MRPLNITLLASLTAALSFGAVACDRSDADVGSQVGESTEKSVDTQQADEALWSKGLQGLICKRIVAKEGVAGHDGKCSGFSYQVTEVSKSTKYAHQSDGRAITMQMKVAVTNPGNGATYDAVLTRALDHKFDLKFGAEISKTAVEQMHDYIRDLADDAGEYARFDDDLADKVNGISLGGLPAAVRSSADSFLADYAADMCAWQETQPCQNGAEFADDAHYEIIKDGDVVGYVVSVWDYIDHPLWDGSGVTLYFDLDGALVTDVSWSG